VTARVPTAGAVVAPDALGRNGPDAMGREIAEGPAGVEATLRRLATSDGDVPRSIVSAARRLVLVGTGASLAVSETAAALFAGRAVVREASTLALAPGGPPGVGAWDGGEVAVVVSMSGRSPESRAAARRAREAGLRVVAVTADGASPLAAAGDAVIVTPIGEETGAATKSALAAFAALATLAGALDPGDRAAVATLTRSLDATVADLAPARRAGPIVARSASAWALGFGPALGLARAEALLLHEKARRPTVFCTPSEFRHGPIEAATAADVVILLDVGDSAVGARRTYLERLRDELSTLGVPLVRIASEAGADLAVPAAAPPVEAILHGFVRAQQLARVAAHVRGTYAEEFLVLRQIVRAADDLVG
jgi:glucosamine--fructose-6-phosphate aminotransferase (isomerizing)